ncbi:helix-turn-helix domain-containing protein [[Clostridium] polysaccharolyticum]|nr:helix-turn-helix domain-containing protein [[Clostridium] polysaccharolyticum]
MSLDEAAEYLGIKTVTLHGWIRDPKNEVPAHKIGRFWKFKRTEIDAWVQSGKSAIGE